MIFLCTEISFEYIFCGIILAETKSEPLYKRQLLSSSIIWSEGGNVISFCAYNIDVRLTETDGV